MSNRFDLEDALAPVREFFSGRSINENTVLAAYMRSAGLPAAGAAWHQAKSAVRQGYSFEAAVRLAEADSGGAKDDGLPNPVDGARSRILQSDQLDWFPKQFGPGDLDGLGAQRLLGSPNLSPADVLVRETAQNSWDAGFQAITEFCINSRVLDGSTLATLREKVLVGGAPVPNLSSLLESDTVRALEISDRGTVGLNGPIRNDRAVDPGVDTNFIDLIFNIGAPKDVHLGGGTYGFGKTVAYTTSGVGTVVYWTRCEGEHGLEDRLIASALGDGYDSNGKRYTGRHWWGRTIAGENRIEPATGAVAEKLGRSIFAKPFRARETGTSILILAPAIGEDVDYVQLLGDAIVRNLWPKLLSDQSGRRVMRIELQSDGRTQDLPQVESHAKFGGFAACLSAVRATQARGRDQEVRTDWPFPVRVHEVRSLKPNKLLGHLALTRYPVQKTGAAAPVGSVALMRNRAELVVKYLERSQIGVDGFQWSGVFKPVEETDDSFADAEPPAHDDWVIASVKDARRKRDVNISLREIKRYVDEFLAPAKNELDRSGSSVPLGRLGEMLSDLIIQPADINGRIQARSGKSVGGGKRSARPIAKLANVEHEPSARESWARTRIYVQVDRAPLIGALVDVNVSIGVDGGSWRDDEMVSLLGWLNDSNGVAEFDLGPRQLKPKDIGVFVYEAREDLAIDVDLRIVDR